jgi:hypothetical protein
MMVRIIGLAQARVKTGLVTWHMTCGGMSDSALRRIGLMAGCWNVRGCPVQIGLQKTCRALAPQRLYWSFVYQNAA